MTWRRHRRPAALAALIGFGCAGPPAAPPGETVRPRAGADDDADFRPIRQLEEGGRATPKVARRCEPGMAPSFAPEDPNYVALLWRASSEFFDFVIAVVPRLLDRAEALADQKGRDHRYVIAAELEIPDAELGGIIELRRRRTGKNILVREKAFTDDLWMRNGATQSVVQFDGRLHYAASQSTARAGRGVRARGWAEVHRLGVGDPEYQVGAEVDLVLRARSDEPGVHVEGVIDVACARAITIEGRLRFRDGAATQPAEMVDRVELRQRTRSLVLEQDDDPRDGCLRVSVDGGPPSRACPAAWTPSKGAVTAERK